MMFHICLIFKRRLPALLLSLLVLIHPTAWAAVQEQYHILVDVSGSMQRVDPQKERVAALKEFINQLPEGSLAGVWAYAGQVNMLVSPSVVNAQWRQKAEQAVSTISGYGPNANLANGLAQATHHWRSAPAKPGRNVILLTDNGVNMVDPVAQSQARQQLLDNVLPQLKKSQVRVFALGFSHEDKALLNQIATDTQGSYQSLATPKEVFAGLVQVKSAIANPSIVATPSAPTVASAPVVEQAVTPAITATSLEAPVETVVEPMGPVQPVRVAAVEVPKIEAAEVTPVIEAPVIQTAVALESTELALAQVTTELATPVEAPTIHLPPATELGQTESNEIKAQLAVAESKLQELMTEASQVNLSASTEGATASPAAALSGQQLSEPMVITLDDGSVLITADQGKADSFSSETTQEVMASDPGNVLGDPAMLSDDLALLESSSEGLVEGITAELSENLEVMSDPVSLKSSFSLSEQGLWPVILSILAILNIAVIFLLFVGRYFWLRHKRRVGSVFTMNYGSVSND